MQKIFSLTFILSLSLFITSCDKDDDVHDDHNHDMVVAPDTYNFQRDGESTVSYTGQTCRLEMEEDLHNALTTPSYTANQIFEMFDNELFNSSKFSLSETLKENANSIKTKKIGVNITIVMF